MRSGDFDGNGTVDLLAANGSTGQVYLNSGAFTFGAAGSTLNFGTYTTLKVGDVNYDGIADIVTGVTDAINIYTGKGNGSFNSVASYAAGSGLNSVDLSDVNNDGYLDITSTSTSDRSANLFLNRKDGTFDSKISYQFGSAGAMRTNFFADINGDGVRDVLYSFGAGGNITTRFSQTNSITSVQHFNLTTQSDAKDALTLIKASKQRLSNELGSAKITSCRTIL